MGDRRIIRGRILDLGESLDSGHSPPSEGTPTMLGRVFDGGSMPTANDHYFLVHPVEIDGTPCEGCGSTVVADTASSVAVDVIGSRVPAVGDVLRCYHAGGRWVAESGSGVHQDSTACLPNCAACGGVVVQPDGSDVVCPHGGGNTATTNNGIGSVSDANGTWTLVNGSGDARIMACESCTGVTSTGITGHELGPRLSGVELYNDTADPGFTPCGHSAGTLFYDWAAGCDVDGNLTLGYRARAFTCGFDGRLYYGSLSEPTAVYRMIEQAVAVPTCSGSSVSATFSFAGFQGCPAPTASAAITLNVADRGVYCCQVFQVYGCNGLAPAGVTASVFRVGPPEFVFVSGLTDSAGQLYLSWFSDCSQHVRIASDGRFAFADRAVGFTADATTTYNLTPAGGYHCFAGRAWPVSDTTHATFLSAGAQVFAQDGTNWVSSFTFAGHAYVCTLTPAGGFSVTKDGTPGSGASFTAGGGDVHAEAGFGGTLDPGSYTELGTAGIIE